MHLRHIRPRSVEWYDALETEGVGRTMVARIPGEVVPLRTMRGLEGMPDDDAGKPSQRHTRPTRQLDS